MSEPSRRLADCPLVIFIAYTVPDDAVERGYCDWLERVDNPFFNGRPGVRHYANWRLDRILRGDAPGWDWFDFQGLAEEADLEDVWFDPGLDAFRAEWIRLWGYGPRDGRLAEVLAHSYLTRPVRRPGPIAAAERALFVAGDGEAPVGSATFRVDDVLAKHFAAGARAATGTTRPAGWRRPVSTGNPLGYDWVGLVGSDEEIPAGATLVAEAIRIAAPDRSGAQGDRG